VRARIAGLALDELDEAGMPADSEMVAGQKTQKFVDLTATSDFE